MQIIIIVILYSQIINVHNIMGIVCINMYISISVQSNLIVEVHYRSILIDLCPAVRSVALANTHRVGHAAVEPL